MRKETLQRSICTRTRWTATAPGPRLNTSDTIRCAGKRGIKTLWLTDHNLIRDTDKAQALVKLGNKVGVHVSIGEELHVKWLKKEHHMLAFFPDKFWEAKSLSGPLKELQQKAEEYKAKRIQRNKDIAERLKKVLGDPEFELFFAGRKAPEGSAEYWKTVAPDQLIEDVYSFCVKKNKIDEKNSLGRPHFLAFLSGKGVDGGKGVNSTFVFGPRSGNGRVDADGNEDANGKYETLLHTAVLEKYKIEAEPMGIKEAIHLVNAAGGRAALAHLTTLAKDKVNDAPGREIGQQWLDGLGALRDAGLWGIEAFSSEISPAAAAELVAAAAKHDLRITAGSDTHGFAKAYADLGKTWRSKQFTAAEAGAGAGAAAEDVKRYPLVDEKRADVQAASDEAKVEREVKLSKKKLTNVKMMAANLDKGEGKEKNQALSANFAQQKALTSTSV